MAVRLKRLNQQVMAITGESSGIGLGTARAAAERGTRLVLASRSHDELQQLKEEITWKPRRWYQLAVNLSLCSRE